MKLHRILLLTFFVMSLISCGGAEERKAAYMEKAIKSIAIGDLDKARIELKNVLQIDPKDGEAYYQIGYVYEQQKEYPKAYGNYIKAEELNPGLLQNQAKLGRIYLLLMNDYEKAQGKVDLILSKDANNADGLLLKAAILLRKKERNEAMKVIKNILAQNPEHVESIIFLASLYLQDKKLDEAINVLDAGLSKNENNEKLTKLLALALVENKDFERAEEIYKDFFERNPDSSSSYVNLAKFYNQIGDEDKSEEILRASIESDSDDDERILTLIYYIYTTKGEDAAIKELTTFVEKNSRMGRLRTGLAELYIRNKDAVSAISVYESAITDFSQELTGVTSRIALASLYINEQKFDKANEIIEGAMKVSPNDPKVNFIMAKLAMLDKNIEQAVISLRIVTNELPENVEAFLLLAAIYQQQENTEQVRSTLNDAFDKNKTNANSLLKLAKYHMSRDIEQAEKIIDTYNNIKEVDYEGLSIKAAILNQNNNQEEAYEIAKMIMNAYPGKPYGYIQAIPYFVQKKDKESAISLLEKGYLSVKDNRKLLVLLTTYQMKDEKFDIVEKRIKAEVASSPEDAWLKILLAKVYLINKNVDSAEALLKEVVAINSGIEEPYLLLSKIYLNKKDMNAVKKILVDGKKSLVDSLKIPIRLASVYEKEEAYKNAIKVYREVYELYPDNLVIANNLASILSDYGNEKDDLELAKLLSEKLKESGQPVFLDTIGWVYYKLGDYQTAINNLTQVIEKAPEVNIFNYHLGMAYKMSGDNTKAKIYLEKSITDNKQFKERDSAIAALKNL